MIGDGSSATASTRPPLRLEWIEAGSLAENPHNWRRHPAGQVGALKDLLDDSEIGWAGACLYNETTNRLIDGHARRNAVDPATPIPVLVGNWSEAAEKKILLTLDPLAGMAVPDVEQLEQLLGEVEFDSDALTALALDLEAMVGRDPPPDEPPATTEEPREREPAEARYDVMVQCQSESQQRSLVERLREEGMTCRALSR